MKLIVFAIALMLSIGLAALGIMSSYRLKRQEIGYASPLFYMNSFYTAFGFYGIWGYLFFRFLFENAELAEHVYPNLVGVIPILGIPLLIAAWYLMLQFFIELVNQKIPVYVTIAYFMLFIIAFFILGSHFKNQVSTQSVIDLTLLLKLIVIINLIFLFTGGGFLLFFKKAQAFKYSFPIIWTSLFIPALISSIALFMASSHWIMVPALVISYFTFIALPSGILFIKTAEETIPVPIDFESFCTRYEISKREAEIIHEICEGKTNKQIADSLFITLQTVKDHTHRIYTKTNVSNRVQLTNLVNQAVVRNS